MPARGHRASHSKLGTPASRLARTAAEASPRQKEAGEARRARTVEVATPEPGSTRQASPPPPLPPMRFAPAGPCGLAGGLDKFRRGLLDGEPQARGLLFSLRRPPPEVTKKYGKGPAVALVEVPPVSIALAEPWREADGNSDCLTHFMKDVCRPLVPQKGPTGTKEIGARRPPPFTLRTDGKQPFPAPASARGPAPSAPPPAAQRQAQQPLTAREPKMRKMFTDATLDAGRATEGSSSATDKGGSHARLPPMPLSAR